MEQNGLSISVVMSSANEHDSTEFVDVMESISNYLDDVMMKEIVTVYADKGYDAKYIRNYLRNNGISCCIPYKINSKFIISKKLQNNYNKTRFVVKRFFACGSKMDFTEQESDMKKLQKIIWHLLILHHF